MKKHGLFKVAIITLLLVVLASWALPITGVSGTEYVTDSATKIGLFTITTNVSIALQYFSHIALYVLAVGGLYGVLHTIPQYRILLNSISKGFRNVEWLFMIIVGVIFAVLSSMAGLSLVLLFLFPFVISIILLMGYDKITAAMLTVGSTIAGLIGSVFSANDVYGITYVLNVSANENIIWKIVLLVLSLIVVLLNTILYARKHKDREHPVKGIFIPKETVTTNRNVAPIVIVMDLLLVVLTLAFISWDVFSIDVFTNMTNQLITPTGNAVSKGILGGLNGVLGLVATNAFGQWTALEAALAVVIASGLISLFYKKSLNEFLTNFAEGAKKACQPAILVVIAYTILVSIVNLSPNGSSVLLSIVRYVASLSEMSIFGMCVVAIVFSFFIAESYYGITAAAGYVLAVATVENVGVVALIWQAMYGVVMLVAPTSVILMVTLSYLGISYGRWFKAIWKVLLELLLIAVVVICIFA